MSPPAKNKPAKPVMRIVRNLARSGGTLIGKCIGSMDAVTLISEIHPADLRTTKPMMQAKDWFGLIGPKDIARWKLRPPTVLQFVSLCDARAQAKNQTLVLRDWSHLDYIGVPFAKPTYGFALAEALSPAYDIRSTVTTRHPIDQYLSLMQLHAVAPKLTFEHYCLGCHRFARHAADHGFHRYEDFTQDPDAVLQQICAELELPFDPTYRDKWHAYTTITGDTTPMVGRGSQKTEIVPLPRKGINESLAERFRANADYQAACQLLGYDP